MSDSEINRSSKREINWQNTVKEISEMSSQRIESDLSDISKLELRAKNGKIESYEIDSVSSKQNLGQIYQDNYTLDEDLTQESQQDLEISSQKKCI